MARVSKNVSVESNTTSSSSVVIAQPRVMRVGLEIEGTSEGLIQNCFSQKAIEQMLRKHMGLSTPREPKIPRACIEQATIRNVNGKVCVPPTAIKKAMLSASTGIKDSSMRKTLLRTALYVCGSSIPITYAEQVPRMDMVRTSGMSRVPDVRFRPMFTQWKARLIIQFADTLAVQTVVDLLNRAGGVGIGEWRPEKDGTFGTFKVTRNITAAKELAEVEDICSVPLVALKIPDWAMDVAIPTDLLARIARNEAEEPEEDEGG